MKRVWVTIVLSALTTALGRAEGATTVTPPTAADSSSRVSISLAEYDGLRKAQERASVTVVDTLRLAGSFKSRDLAVVFSGRSAGSLPATDVLSRAAGIVLYGCDGDGILSRGDGGAFRLTPLAGRFSVRCRLATQGSDRLEMGSTSSVLWVESDVADGELVLGGESSDGSRQFSVVRRVAAAAEGLKASATGRYKITLRPDETRFHYEIEVHNPNRSRQPFDVTLASGEHVQQVDAQVSYDVQANRYRFDVPPGEVTLTLSGNLPGTTFEPPIEASIQYCVLDSHPLLRPVVAGEPKRVSPQEVGLPTDYRGAQAFIVIGREKLAWSVTRLEAMRTTSFAVSRAAHFFFLPADGPVLGQSEIAIDNQGSPDVSLPMAAEPTFASLQGEPVLLTKDASGNLWLPIAQGQQQLLVQHRQSYRRVPGFGFASLAIPQLPVPATYGTVSLRYPEEWTPLYESFISEARIWTPESELLVFLLLLLFWTERTLAALKLDLRRRLVLAVALALAAAAWGWASIAVVVGNAVVAVLLVIPWLRARRWGVVVALLLVAVAFVLLVMAVSIPSLLRARVATAPYPSRSYEREDKAAAAPPTEAAAKERQAPSYQGLPAKLEMPSSATQHDFSRALLDTETPRVVRVVMVSQTLLGWLQLLIVLAALGLLWREGPDLAAGWRARVAATRPPGEKAPAEAGTK